MKKILLACGLLVSMVAVAQQPALFKTKEFSFGKIVPNVPVTTEFTFVNTTAKPLIVENATAGCGCTTPVFPKEPIAKGKSGAIKVTFNAQALGPFNKDVTVKFAGIDQPIVLNIRGEVEDTKQGVNAKKVQQKKHVAHMASPAASL